MTDDKGILIRNIYYMLSYAFQELRQNNYAEIEGEPFDNIYDLFAEILAKGISSQLKQGLYREYIPQKESLQTVRGKIDINATIANRMHKNQRISCEYDILSENNLLNQILVTTSQILIRNSDVKKPQKSKLKQLMLFFQNVEAIDIHNIRWNTIRFDRNNRNYRMLLYICYFVISEWLLTTEEGKFRLKEFSDDHMCRLYEKFILEYYKRHHPECKPSAKVVKWNFDMEKVTPESLSVLPIMQTDIFIEKGERTLIIDAKYYSHSLGHHMAKDVLHSPNFYQINSYVLNYDSKHTGLVDGLLLYAQTKNEGKLDYEYPSNDGNVFYIKSLDLNQPFELIKEQLENLIN